MLDDHYSQITQDINEAKAKLGDSLIQVFLKEFSMVLMNLVAFYFIHFSAMKRMRSAK